MAYTIIFLSQTNTHQSTRSLHLNPWVLRLAVVGLILLPFATFMLGARTFSSKKLVDRLEDTKTAYAKLEIESNNLRDAYDAMMEEQAELNQQLDAERKNRAEIEARAAITDNARANTSTHLQKTKKEIYDLTRRVKMYESLIAPSEEKLPLQCYNIEVGKNRKGFHYYVRFLKTDGSDEKEINMKVKLRLLSGNSIVALKEVPLGDEGSTDTNVTKLRELRGQIGVPLPTDRLRVLDISAYDGDTLVSNCWKVF